MNDETPIKPYRTRTEFTQKEYAALVTGQPCSGTEWLDNMIRSQRRERLAGQALVGMLANSEMLRRIAELRPEMLRTMTSKECDSFEHSCMAKGATLIADALISALEGGAK